VIRGLRFSVRFGDTLERADANSRRYSRPVCLFPFPW
jgi:hypothetical protein